MLYYSESLLLEDWMFDLFTDVGCATPDLFGYVSDDFHWVVAVFRAKGATEAIKRANDARLRTYYPFRRSRSGNFIPLWMNYLFIEFKHSITLNICRSTTNFIKILSIPDDNGINHPILVKRSAIYENQRLLQLGKFDSLDQKRRFYGQGSLVNIIYGDFIGRKVELLADIPTNVSANKKILVNMNGWKVSIEIFKLAL
jgi:hypothetical protein